VDTFARTLADLSSGTNLRAESHTLLALQALRVITKKPYHSHRAQSAVKPCFAYRCASVSYRLARHSHSGPQFCSGTAFTHRPLSDRRAEACRHPARDQGCRRPSFAHRQSAAPVNLWRRSGGQQSSGRGVSSNAQKNSSAASDPRRPQARELSKAAAIAPCRRCSRHPEIISLRPASPWPNRRAKLPPGAGRTSSHGPYANSNADRPGGLARGTAVQGHQLNQGIRMSETDHPSGGPTVRA